MKNVFIFSFGYLVGGVLVGYSVLNLLERCNYVRFNKSIN